MNEEDKKRDPVTGMVTGADGALPHEDRKALDDILTHLAETNSDIVLKVFAVLKVSAGLDLPDPFPGDQSGEVRHRTFPRPTDTADLGCRVPLGKRAPRPSGSPEEIPSGISDSVPGELRRLVENIHVWVN